MRLLNLVRRFLQYAAGVVACSEYLNAAVFTFDSDAIGKATTFTDTDSGLSATFSSPADPGGFVVRSTFFSTLTGNILFDPGPAGANNIPLTIAFNSNLSSLSMLFAVASGADVAFVLNAFQGATHVGSASAFGTVPPGGRFGFPEGSISFSGPFFFNRVVLTSAAPDIAIDDVNATVGVGPVPEPASFAMLGLGLVFLGGMAHRLQTR